MKIEFFNITTGEVLKEADDNYFVMANKVYRDNHRTYESQQSAVSFDDFIIACSDIDWRVSKEPAQQADKPQDQGRDDRHALDDLQICYKPSGSPDGIRDRGGLLCFFTEIFKYDGQEARYKEEIERQQCLANYLLKCLLDCREKEQGRDDVIEECAIMASKQMLTQRMPGESKYVWNNAIASCMKAIRQLKEPSNGK